MEEELKDRKPHIDPLLGPVVVKGKLDEEKDEGQEEDLLPGWIGNFGWWQGVTYTLTGLMIVVHSWQMLCMKFLAYPVDHWCSRPPIPELYSLTNEEWRNLSAPVLENGKFDKCHMYDLDYTDYHQLTAPSNTTPTIECHWGWDYDESHFKNTIVKRWDLVCEDAFLPRISQTVFFLGNMIGVFFCGIIADKFGRKRTMMWSLQALVVTSVIASLSDYFALWTVVRFFVGAVTLSMNTCISVYVVENTGARYRAYVHALTGGLFWSSGTALLALLVWLVPDMHVLEWIMAGCAAVFLPMQFFLPESPRWLLAKGKHDRAKRQLRFISKMNGRYGTNFKEDYVYDYHVKGADADKQQKGTLKDLFAYQGLRRNFLSMCFCWFSFSMGYFGLMYNAPAREGSVYLVFAMPALLHIVVLPLFPFLQGKFGRKAILTLPLIFAGIIMMCTMAVPADKTLVTSILSIIGVIGCGLAFDTGYLLTKELFPTVLRTTALSSSSASARIGSILSPLIGGLDKFSPELPLAVYGVIVLMAGIQSVVIWPETNKVKLPDSVEESEEVAHTRNKWLPCCKQEGKPDLGEVAVVT